MNWWEWSNPGFTLGVIGIFTGAVGAVATIFIPILLYKFQRKNEELDGQILDQQRKILMRQRRDDLLATLPATRDSARLKLLEAEIGEFVGSDRRTLIHALRQNPLHPLPTGRVNSEAIQDFLDSLPHRFKVRDGGPFSGLVSFVRACERSFLKDGSQAFVEELDWPHRLFAEEVCRVIAGEAIASQRPGHRFFRDFVFQCGLHYATPLLYKAADIDAAERGGLRLNAFVGVLLAAKELQESAALTESGSQVISLENDEGFPWSWSQKVPDIPRLTSDELSSFQGTLQDVLANLLHRYRAFDDMGRWNLDGQSEPAAAAVAWLIRAVGHGCGLNYHIDMRCVQHLSGCVRSLPKDEPKRPIGRTWGSDKEDIIVGLRLIQARQPELWREYGQELVTVTGVRL